MAIHEAAELSHLDLPDLFSSDSGLQHGNQQHDEQNELLHLDIYYFGYASLK